MNIVFRCLLTLYTFCIAVFSLMAMIVTLRPVAFKSMASFLENSVLYYNKYTILFFVIELFFFCISVVFLLSGIRDSKNKRLITNKTTLGEIKISIDTIESIVLGTVKKIQLIKESKVYVENREGKLIILVKLVVMLDANIPALVLEVQEKSKKAIEDNTGLKVDEVQVLVDDVCNTYKPRVE